MRRPRLAPGFTAMIDAGSVWLVAGEDIRYRLTVADPTWLRDMLARCDGTREIDELVAATGHESDARTTIEQLFEERVLVEGTAAQAHAPVPRGTGFHVVGTGVLADALRACTDSPRTDSPRTDSPHSISRREGAPNPVEVFVQDSLDFRAVLARNREAIAARRKWMWITTGPGGRAYVGPLFVPDAGACAECLLVHFKRLSPVPDLYDVVLAHEGPIEATPFPDAAIDVVVALAKWKLALASEPMAAPPYALHVIELADLTISSHAPLVDVECAACR